MTLETLDDAATVVDIALRPQFRAIGKRFGNRTQAVAQAVRAAEPIAVAAALQTSGKATITIDGEEVTLGPEEIDVVRSPRSGWFVATEDNLTVALDLEITPQLRRTGVARDVVRLIQQARKDIGLQITDRIKLTWSATDETAESIKEHRDHIQAEVLAVTCAEESDRPAAPATAEDPHLGVKVWIEPANEVISVRDTVEM